MSKETPSADGEGFAFFCWARHRVSVNFYQGRPQFATYNRVILMSWKTRHLWIRAK